MAYNETLARSIRSILASHSGITEIQMFGGISFLLNGNMIGGVLNDDLIIRVGLQKYDDYLKLPQTQKFNITGRAMKGWLMVSKASIDADQDLSEWVQRGVDFASSLPPK